MINVSELFQRDGGFQKYRSPLTHCILNRLCHSLYWKSPVSILGMSGYEIYIFLEKNC